MSYETILVEQRDAVTLVTLNRPKALNALNSQVLEDLIAAFAAYEADAGQRCLVLTGSGDKAFAAGADIKEMSEKASADFFLDDFFSRWTSHLVKSTRKPWIAAVNGFALGGGCEVAMMADIIIASENAKFGQPEIKLGVAPGMGGSQRLTRAVGKAKAMEMCLTGRMMAAEDAERSGLVARVVSHDDLIEDAMNTATRPRWTRGWCSNAACSRYSQRPKTRSKAWPRSWRSAKENGRAADRSGGECGDAG